MCAYYEFIFLCKYVCARVVCSGTWVQSMYVVCVCVCVCVCADGLYVCLCCMFLYGCMHVCMCVLK